MDHLLYAGNDSYPEFYHEDSIAGCVKEIPNPVERQAAGAALLLLLLD